MLDFKQAEKEIKEHRSEVIEKLVEFSFTDVILFWSANEEIKSLQTEKWLPVLKWLNNRFKITLKETDGLTPPPQNENNRAGFTEILDKMSLKNLTTYYLAAVRLKSPLLAFAFAEKKITASEAFELAYLEELYQSKSWGVDEEAEQSRQCVKNELLEIEEFLHGKK